MQFAGKFEYDINGEDDDERVSIKEQTLERAKSSKAEAEPVRVAGNRNRAEKIMQYTEQSEVD